MASLCVLASMALGAVACVGEPGISLTVTNRANEDVCVYLLSSRARQGERPDTSHAQTCHGLRPGERGELGLVCGANAVSWLVLQAGGSDFFETKARCDAWRKAGAIVTVRSDLSVETGLGP